MPDDFDSPAAPAAQRPTAGFPVDRTAAAAADYAARRIAEEGAAWKTAQEEARRHFGCELKSEAIAHALRARFALFAPEAHAKLLREKREAARFVMLAAARASGLELRLVGHVLEGSATERSAVELVALSLASGEPLDDKTVSLALLNAGFEPEVFDAPYPTAYARRARGAMTTLLVHAGGEPVLIRVPDRPMPLPKPVSPDAYQSELEASGAVDRSMLEALLAASDD